ncbi:hypothetical protein [Phormidium tenue]|uniref:hypothetical protein n=1 Tax=Phormidium tenue TaxID=126344 RepID=UPI0015C5600F|nr:hypothetical protein [Phormidium tenue]MBD2233426.1 hypothetical protein [Phormidium tenue FACHB-1052]
MCQSSMFPTEDNNAVKCRPSSSSNWLGLVGSLVVIATGLLGGAHPALAQLVAPVGIDSLITTPQLPANSNSYTGAPYASPCDATVTDGFPGCGAGTINISFGTGSDRILTAVEIAGTRFEPADDFSVPPVVPDQVVFRRAGPPLGNGGAERQLLFYERVPNAPPTVPPNIPLNLGPSEVVESPGIETIATAMLNPAINRGIDNVFNNTQDGPGDQDTRNNIERIDYIIGSGAAINTASVSPSDVGFLVLERGGNDAFSIAAITQLDGAGNPIAYGPLVQVPGGTWGGDGVNATFSTAVLRRDEPAPVAPALRPTHIVGSQSIRGIFFPINSLLLNPTGTVTTFGFSLFAADITPAIEGTNGLVNFAGFPLDTDGTSEGGLDLVAGGFGLIRRVGGFSLVKRISNLDGPSPLPDFSQVIGTESGINLLRNNSLGQGLITISDPPVVKDNGIEYSIYLANSSNTEVTNLLVCDQIPAGTTFDPNAYGTGLGIRAIASSSPAGPEVDYTNAAGDDPGTFFAPGTVLPDICGPDQNNGAVVVDVGTINANQVGLVRFRTKVN